MAWTVRILSGKCPECGKPYRLTTAGEMWLAAHWHDPTAWPMTVTLPCGHKRNEVYHMHFREEKQA